MIRVMGLVVSAAIRPLRIVKANSSAPSSPSTLSLRLTHSQLFYVRRLVLSTCQPWPRCLSLTSSASNLPVSGIIRRKPGFNAPALPMINTPSTSTMGMPPSASVTCMMACGPASPGHGNKPVKNQPLDSRNRL